MLVQSPGFAVSQMPVSMGTFNIEGHTWQAAISYQLTFSELKNTANLIDRFTSQDYSEASDRGVASLYSHRIWEYDLKVNIPRL
jgi:hypothetical protein